MDKWTFDQRAHHLKQLVESRDDELEEKKKDGVEGEYEGEGEERLIWERKVRRME